MSINQRWEVCFVRTTKRYFDDDHQQEYWDHNTDIDDLAADGWEPMQIVDGSMWLKRPVPPKKPVEGSTPKQTTRKSDAERADLPSDHPDHSCRDCGVHHDDCKECGTSQGEGHNEGCKWLRR